MTTTTTAVVVTVHFDKSSAATTTKNTEIMPHVNTPTKCQQRLLPLQLSGSV